jgi:ribosome-associated translation inhibitor RaiA
MVKVIFKNLERSDLIREIASEKVEKALQKYAVVDPLASTVVLSREHSREHTGVDEFSVKLMVGARGHKPVIVEKRSTSITQALASVLDRAMDLLHQSFARERLGVRHERRRWKTYQRWKNSFATWNEL